MEYNKNYLTYFAKNMRITQDYNGETSHYAESHGIPYSYPIDDGCSRAGYEDPIYCNCDALVVKRIYGVGNGGTNTIWLESLNPVVTPSGIGTVTMMFVHMNDDDIKNISVGQIFKRGDLMFHEGHDNAPSHIHVEVALGNFTGNGWVKNSLGGWVLTTTGEPLKPEDAYYIDPAFTTIEDDGELEFKRLMQHVGKPTTRDTSKNQIEVLIDNLRARTSPNGKIIGYINRGIYDIVEVYETNDYVWYRVGEYWIAHDSEWSTIYNKEIVPVDNIDEELETVKKAFLTTFRNIFRKIIKWIGKIITKQ